MNITYHLQYANAFVYIKDDISSSYIANIKVDSHIKNHVWKNRQFEIMFFNENSSAQNIKMGVFHYFQVNTHIVKNQFLFEIH